MYWEMSSDSRNTIVASLFTRNRFLDVLQYLHLADNNNLNPNDKFSKVNPLFKMINESCLQNFIPEKNVSIDESMVPYYGRHGCKQYIQNKPVKFGYKLWVAATPLGYAIQFYPYDGKDDNYNKDIGLGGSVVMTLMSKLPTVPNLNYHVVMDNFFTSPSLLRLLKRNGMAAAGTVRASRTENAPLQAVDDMKKKARRRSDVVNGNKSNVTLVCWKDNKVVTVASTLYGKEPMKRARRYINDKGGRVEIDQPNSISVYNKTMGGIDRMDQNIGAYMIKIRSKKWRWPLFRFCVDLAVNNAFQLYHLQPLQKEKNNLICGDLGEKLSRYIMQDFDRIKPCLQFFQHQEATKESFQKSATMESTTGLPKETNVDVPNVQKRANIFVKSAMLVFIQIVLRIFIQDRL